MAMNMEDGSKVDCIATGIPRKCPFSSSFLVIFGVCQLKKNTFNEVVFIEKQKQKQRKEHCKLLI